MDINFIYEYYIQDNIISIIIIIVTIFGSLLIRRTTKENTYVKKYFQNANINKLQNIFSIPITLSFILIGIWFFIQTIQIQGLYETYIKNTFITIAIIIWAKSFLDFGDEYIETIIAEKYDEELAPIIENIWTILLIIFVINIFLDTWGIDITPLLASAGVIGVVLGFAARETIANFFGSIALYADNTYQKGDFIKLEDGQKGTVIDISIRSTMLETLDGNRIHIPNSTLNESSLENESRPKPKKRIKIPVGVEYNTDPNTVKKLLINIAEEKNIVENNPKSVVEFNEFGESSLKFNLFVWIQDPKLERQARDELNETIYEELEQNNINIPYPQRDVHIDK